MVYRVLGIVNNPAGTGVELAFIEFDVNGQKWVYERKASAAFSYSVEWQNELHGASGLSALAYLQLHNRYGALLGSFIKQLIKEQDLEYQVQLIGSPGYSVFTQATHKLSHSLGDGAAIAAATGINVVSDFFNKDAALGGTNTSDFSFEKLMVPKDEIFVPAIFAAFFAILRWREENNLFAEQTGALRDSIGGAVWIGQDW